MNFVIVAVAFVVVLVLFVYLFRVLATIVDGLRSINATTIRLAETLESMANDRQ